MADVPSPLLVAECARSLALSEQQVRTVAGLIADGATIPFMARYRKERTGSLDEEQLRHVRDLLAKLEAREQRRTFVIEAIAAQDKLTSELDRALNGASTIQELEDLYLPFKPKRQTRAEKARVAGLEPLALEILAQKGRGWRSRLGQYHCEAYGSDDDVLAGCRDIIAEMAAHDPAVREPMRRLYHQRGTVEASRAKENAKFADYYNFAEPVKRIKGHRVLALLRGQREGALRLKLSVDSERAMDVLRQRHFRGEQQVALALEDSFKRLVAPAMETEVLNALREAAEADAIAVFADNVRQALLEAPLGPKRVLALDPGFRTGCKLAALDETGALLDHGVIYPVEPHNKTKEAEAVVRNLVGKQKIEAIAVGNGTAGRETEAFVRSLQLKGVVVVMVNESGASVYSASEVARSEFPDLDLTVRGAISIGRRLKDPLAELVKIDPRSIGVGQYQYDVDQKALKATLDDVVVECVNRVGVDLNQASPELFSHVSGLTRTSAANIVAHRSVEGPFDSRTELKKVKGVGPKAFEQAAGFLRITGARNPLDGSAVHPESYAVALDLLQAAGLSSRDIGTPEGAGKLAGIRLEDFVRDEVGMPTLRDIVAELSRPGRDPRDRFEAPSFAEGIDSIDDLAEGMILEGVVTNLTRFGAFVDVGVHQDGLVHVSQIADRFVSDPRAELSLRQRVRVMVISVDRERRRIGLSIRSAG